MNLKIYGLFLRSIQWIVSLFYNGTKPHIIIGSSAGTNVNGNSKALFMYMHNTGTPIKGYFITRNKSLYKEFLIIYPSHFLYAYSVRALIKIITAKAYIITHGPWDITPFIITSSKKPLINLWHGFPIKKLGTDAHNLSKNQKKKVLGNFNGLVVMSEEEKVHMSRCYHTKPENTWVTGYPRNDFSFHRTKAIINQIPFIEGKKVLLYAPTWRDEGKTKLFPFKDFNLEELETFLEKNNAVLLLRIHKNELKQHNLEESNVLKICDGDVVQEISELLPYVDILITDYSSVYIDQLLVDKPMIFVPYDLEEFRNIRGFNYDFNAVSPGPKVKTFAGFRSAIEKYLSDPSLDSAERTRMKNKFHSHQDDQSSKRVYEKIEHLIKSTSRHNGNGKN